MTSLHFRASLRNSNLLILLCLSSLYSLAQVKNLTQPGFQWHEPTAWAPTGVPTTNDSVIINGLTFIMPDSVAYAKFVYVGPIGSLEVQRDLANNVPGKLFLVDPPENGFENNGTVKTVGESISKTRLNMDWRIMGIFKIWTELNLKLIPLPL